MIMERNAIMDIIQQLNGMKIDTVCFTGSRPNKLRGYIKNSYVPFVSSLTDILSLIHATFGTSKYVSGGAQGMDQLSFWAVDRLKNSVSNKKAIKNILHKPFNGQELRWKETGLFSQAEYNTMCKYADEIVIVTDNVSSEDYRQVCKALDDRNHSMVDISDLVIALYEDSNWLNAQGSGTANCMKYAHKMHKPILQLMYKRTNNMSEPLIITNVALYM